MSMRTFSAAALLLAACSSQADAPLAANEDDLVECALGGAGSFTRECTLERVASNESEVLVVRHPDGGFRRFISTAGGIAPADGAEPATLIVRDDSVEVAVGGDRYRFAAVLTADGTE